jgi:hypothetical protein
LTLILMRGREAVPRKVDDDWQSSFEMSVRKRTGQEYPTDHLWWKIA